MINAKDIKIGDLLEHNGEIVHVTSTSLDIDDEYQPTVGVCKYGANSNEVIGSEEEFNPIPLTPEWLERCGFAENDRGYYVLVSGSFYLLKNDLKDENGNIEGYVLVAAGSHGLVQKLIYKHLHQLQNLFFALTGDELTIKEKV